MLTRAARNAPMLTLQRERMLIAAVRRGDLDALDALTAAHLRLVIKLARPYESSGIPLPDLVQEGLIGFASAIDRFDPSRGFRLSTFAQRAVGGAIQRAVEQQGRVIRLPRRQLSKIACLEEMSRRFRAEFHRQPTADDILDNWERLGGSFSDGPVGDEGFTSDHEIRELFEHAEQMVVLYGLRPDDASSSDDRDTAALISAAEERDALRDAVKALAPAAREVISRRYGLFAYDTEQLHEVAAHLELPRYEVRRIERAAMARLLQALDRRLGRAA